MQNEYSLHSERDDLTGLRLVIRPDQNAPDPRSGCDHLASMTCWHRRYRLGDPHDYSSPAAFEAAMISVPHLRLPLYLYDHSGLTIATSPFSCLWDQGQIGWIWASLAAIRREYGVRRVTKAVRDRALALMRSEAREYDMYLRGDVWQIDIGDADGAISEGRAMFASLVAAQRSDGFGKAGYVC